MTRDTATETASTAAARDAISEGRATLGIELGSTRIKACLIGDDPAVVVASGSHAWENEYVDGAWTYSLEDVWAGLQAAFVDLVADIERRYGTRLEQLAAIGVSAMMHGYLALDGDDRLLVPFRTWRNTSTGAAAAELSERFGVNVPMRWSIAHLYQAVLDDEPHLAQIRSINTLAGHVHAKLTGRRILGVGDASGMFPIDPSGASYDPELAARFDEMSAGRIPAILDLLPEVLVAGRDAGSLTAEGAALLDPSGALHSGSTLCPPEGDAGTGMVATNSIAPRTGNVSAGTSIFAMVVLEKPLVGGGHKIDVVTTPAGDPVAMVHCNNGASELGAWASVFGSFAGRIGASIGSDAVFEALLLEALDGDSDAGGLLAYNQVAGEPVADLIAGRPLIVRTPDSRLTLANLMRAQVYGVFGSLALGMRELDSQGVTIDRMLGHGGVFRTAGVAQRFLAGALRAPVAIADTASEGGAWGIAVLASYVRVASEMSLAVYLDAKVFASTKLSTLDPDPNDVVGFDDYLIRYEAGLAVERAAAEAL